MRYFSSTAGVMKLVGAVGAADTTLAVDTVAGLPGAWPFTLVLDVGQPEEEIITVTAASGTTLTVQRGQDGTSAQSHADQAVVRHMMSARDLREPQDHIAADNGVHGVTGNLVGDTDVQTLSAKTFTPATAGDPALIARAKTGQTRNIVEVTNATGSGIPFLAVDSKGCTTLAGNGTNPPLQVLDRVDDATTLARFQVYNDGGVVIGSATDATQSMVKIRLKNSSDGASYERRSYVTQPGDGTASAVADALVKNDVVLYRTQLRADGLFQVPQVYVDNCNFTNAITAAAGFAVSNQLLTKVGPLVTLTFDVSNNTGASINPIDTAGNINDTTIANIASESLNPGIRAAILTFRGNNGGIIAAGWGYITTFGGVVLTEYANQNMRWPNNAGGADSITVTASYTTLQ